MGYIGKTPTPAPLTSSDIAADIINNTHIGDTAISGFDALATAPADTDEFLISDAGVLKRLDASLVGGGVVQSINHTITNTIAAYSYSNSNNNTTNQVDTKITPLAVSVTPKSTSSKFIICVSMAGETGDSAWDYTFGLTRSVGGTDYMLAINNGVANQTGTRGKQGLTAPPTTYGTNSSNNDSTPEVVNLSFVDTPNTTSAITYTATFNNDNSGNWQLNACQSPSNSNERFVSTIYFIEF